MAMCFGNSFFLRPPGKLSSGMLSLPFKSALVTHVFSELIISIWFMITHMGRTCYILLKQENVLQQSSLDFLLINFPKKMTLSNTLTTIQVPLISCSIFKLDVPPPPPPPLSTYIYIVGTDTIPTHIVYIETERERRRLGAAPPLTAATVRATTVFLM
ncbi:hypothetical protein HanPI659440_Chr08g0301841 [Helianthus annuus]|nr:hypothetical protein HanPI659440_Chr08g0301841 [Helianthus annuus]